LYKTLPTLNFFISPQKKDTNHKKYFTIQYLSNEEKYFS